MSHLCVTPRTQGQGVAISLRSEGCDASAISQRMDVRITQRGQLERERGESKFEYAFEAGRGHFSYFKFKLLKYIGYFNYFFEF